jgi:chromosome partitioning protein
MARILAITNQKGGVGKTTTTVNLAACLAEFKQRVLLVDLDPQGNATMGCGIDKSHLSHTVYHLLLGMAAVDTVLIPAPSCHCHIIPANRELAGAEVELVSIEDREHRLQRAIKQVEADYDYILIDCPPALNLLTVNALAAAHAVMIPMQCEYYALEGLSDLVSTVRKVRAGLNPRLEIDGLLRTMFDPRNTLAQQVSSQLEQHFGEKVYSTVIPRNVRLAEAPSYGKPVIEYDRTSKGSVAYLALAEEVLQRAQPAAMPMAEEGAT